MAGREKIMRLEICLVYTHFFNHLSLSMPISLMLIKEEFNILHE